MSTPYITWAMRRETASASGRDPDARSVSVDRHSHSSASRSAGEII